LTHKAEADVDAVLRWFRDQSAVAAGTRWLRALLAKRSALESFPLRRPVAPESLAAWTW